MERGQPADAQLGKRFGRLLSPRAPGSSLRRRASSARGDSHPERVLVGEGGVVLDDRGRRFAWDQLREAPDRHFLLLDSRRRSVPRYDGSSDVNQRK